MEQASQPPWRAYPGLITPTTPEQRRQDIAASRAYAAKAALRDKRRAIENLAMQLQTLEAQFLNAQEEERQLAAEAERLQAEADALVHQP